MISVVMRALMAVVTNGHKLPQQLIPPVRVSQMVNLRGRPSPTPLAQVIGSCEHFAP